MTTLINPGFYSVNVGATVTPPAVKDPWTGSQGFYAKISRSDMQDLYNGTNASKIAKLQNELVNNPLVMGWQIPIDWALCEGSGSGSTSGTINFDYYDEVLSYLPDGKFAIMMLMNWREFGFGLGGDPIYSRLLPPDMWASYLTYMYMITSTKYSLILPNPTLQTRMKAFYQAFADKYDNDPRIIGVSTTESVGTAPTTGGWSSSAVPYTEAQWYAARTDLVLDTKLRFDYTMTINDGALSRAYCEDWYDVGVAAGVCPSSSNSEWWSAIYNTDDGSDRAILPRFATSAASIPIFSQLQGDDFQDIDPITGLIAPTNKILARVGMIGYPGDARIYPLKSHYCIVQRGAWWDGTGVYAGRGFWDEILANGAGVLNATRPSRVL